MSLLKFLNGTAPVLQRVGSSYTMRQLRFYKGSAPFYKGLAPVLKGSNGSSPTKGRLRFPNEKALVLQRVGFGSTMSLHQFLNGTALVLQRVGSSYTMRRLRFYKGSAPVTQWDGSGSTMGRLQFHNGTAPILNSSQTLLVEREDQWGRSSQCCSCWGCWPTYRQVKTGVTTHWRFRGCRPERIYIYNRMGK